MNIEQRLQTGRRSVQSYEARIAAFESGTAIPDIGELVGTRRLLQRAERRLRALEIMRMALPQNVRVAHCH